MIQINCVCIEFSGASRVSIPHPFAPLGRRTLKEAPSQGETQDFWGEGVDPGGREARKSGGASRAELARGCTTFRISGPLVPYALRTRFTEVCIPWTAWIPA